VLAPDSSSLTYRPLAWLSLVPNAVVAALC
jgi:hypothetical protein